MTPAELAEVIVGKTIKVAFEFSRGLVQIETHCGERYLVRDRLGASIGYLGYFNSPVDSVEHVGHTTFVRGADGDDQLRLVTVGWSV